MIQRWAVSLSEDAQPWQGKKKGVDTGIDGIRYFRDLDRKEVHTMLLSVKGGENVRPSMVKELIATLARDGADTGLLSGENGRCPVAGCQPADRGV